MKLNKQTLWQRIALSLSIAYFSCALVSTILIKLPVSAQGNFTNSGNDGSFPVSLDNADVYTNFLPLVFNCWPQPFQRQLEDTGGFAGEVKILTPKSCTTGFAPETAIIVTGTYAGVPDTVDIWVLAYPPNELYYPQSPNACAGEKLHREGGKWQVPVYLGRRGGDPEWFDIVAVLVDVNGSAFLSNWVKEGCLQGDYLGIPAGMFKEENIHITEKSFIFVQTRD